MLESQHLLSAKYARRVTVSIVFCPICKQEETIKILIHGTKNYGNLINKWYKRYCWAHWQYAMHGWCNP